MTLTRRKPLRAQPRSKGNRAERAVIDLLRAYGWTHARRNLQSGGQGGGDWVEGPADVSGEIKHCERADIWKWIRQCEAAARPTEIPLVVCRCNGMDWWAVLPRDEWHALEELDSDPPQVTTSISVGEGARLSFWSDLSHALRIAVDGRPRLYFTRKGSGHYAAVPFIEVLEYLRLREFGL